MAALCQRVSWHHVGVRSSLGSWATPVETCRVVVGVRARNDSPFTEKTSVKRVRGGGQPSGVALPSLELWSSSVSAARARDTQGVSPDGFRSFTSVSAEFRESKDEASGT